MSIAGILDAMHATQRPPAERWVWACLENHANGARWWAITLDALAAELGFNKATVVRAVNALEIDGIIRRETKHRQVTVYHMLRVYGGEKERNVRPDSASVVESLFATQEELDAQNATQASSVDAQNATQAPFFDAQNATPSTTERKNPTAASRARAYVREGEVPDGDSTAATPPAGNFAQQNVPATPPPGCVKVDGEWVPIEPPKLVVSNPGIERWSRMGSPDPKTGKAAINGFDIVGVMHKACEIARITNPQAEASCRDAIARWLSEGVEANGIYDALRRAAAREDYKPPFSLKWFDKRIKRPAQARAG